MSIFKVFLADISRVRQTIWLHCLLAHSLFHYSSSRRHKKLLLNSQKIIHFAESSFWTLPMCQVQILDYLLHLPKTNAVKYVLSIVDHWWQTTLTLCKSHFYIIWKYIIYFRETRGKKGPEIVASNRAPQVPALRVSLVLQAAPTMLITTGDQVCWLTHIPWLGIQVTWAASVSAQLHTSQQLGWHPV